MENDLISRSHFDERIRLAAGADADEEFTADFLDGVKTVLYMLSTEPPVQQEMSDKDLISRSWLLAEYDRQHEGPAGKARKLIEDAPGEMSAMEFLKTKARMETAMGFPGIADIERIRDAVAFAEKWAREHPEEGA